MNALDFGYNYVTVDFGKSNNIDAPDAKGKFIHLADVYGTQKSFCLGDGLCNLMSPAIPELRRVNITSLPARLRLDLWKNMPTVDNQKADFYYDINFE